MSSTSHLPVVFISHGAPTFALEPGQLGPRLTALGQAIGKPRAVLIVSPHWMTRGLRVATTAAPKTVHDFGGFDRALYRLNYPAPGHPELALRTAEVLREAGWEVQPDEEQGLDHGAWVPLRYLYPDADVPVFQLSLPAGLSPEQAYALGTALRPLRDEGVLVVGSGSLTHNLYEARFEDGAAPQSHAREFADWVRYAVEARDHAKVRSAVAQAPHGRRAHPTDEHYLPLVVAAGTASQDEPAETLEGGILYGVLAMDSFVFGRR